MCLSYSNFHPIADDCCKATWSQTESPLAFHGKDNWECLGLYHRNHKDKGFNGDGHSPGPVISRCVACVLAIHAQVMGVWAQRLDGRAPPAMCMATHRQPTADEQPGVAKGETYGRTLHKSKPASISGNNHGLVCTKDTGSMSVCIRIEGFDGKWWQGKTILCIPNKPSSCFRWQRLAVLCHLFCQEQRKWMQSPKNQRKNLHTKTQGTGILVASLQTRR